MLPSLQFSAANYSATETSSTITLNQTSTLPISIVVTSSDGSVIAGNDYATLNQVVSLPVGHNQATVSLLILADSLLESLETLMVTLRNPFNATSGSPTVATVTIVDRPAIYLPLVLK